ncbi:hypothetical protein EVAR_17910_1 [Eumeta japonica]|uniref:FLYWCH-type domain-containing protein n=1 Tax=Eumeta variegata TaxID=151549 RepID=A0A4C1UY50_EUMVA|nr:hypothetical protein EVAR_17910_1 [Eumeta japonica]
MYFDDFEHRFPSWTITSMSYNVGTCVAVRYTISKRGKPIVEIDGYRFCEKFRSGYKTRWCCSTHNYRGCRALLHTIGTDIIRMRNEHNHYPVCAVLERKINIYR